MTDLRTIATGPGLTFQALAEFSEDRRIVDAQHGVSPPEGTRALMQTPDQQVSGALTGP